MLDETVLPWFWELLAAAGRNLRALCRQLEHLSQERLKQYRAAFEDAKGTVDPYHDWEACVPYISKWPSEEDADDFSAWVVMQGQEFYQQVRNSPEKVQLYLDLFHEVEMKKHPEMTWDTSVDREEYRGYQRADYIATPIYKTRFGEELPDDDFMEG
jgi:hypothetical protein